MYDKIVTAFFVFSCLLNEILAKHSQTCNDLEKNIDSSNVKIETLNKELLEYKLAYKSEMKDVSDVCNPFKTCNDCLLENCSVKCGWCYLYSRCSLKENCEGSSSDLNSWIPKTRYCPDMGIGPILMDYSTRHLVYLYIHDLPKYDGNFICVFEVFGKSLITRANRTETRIECPTPEVHSLPKFPEREYILSFEVSIRTAFGPKFLPSKVLKFFDCGRYDSCVECTSSSLRCFWCAIPPKCTSDWRENCMYPENRNEMSETRVHEVPGSCPRILPDEEYVGNFTHILIPTGSNKRIFVNAKKFPPFQHEKEFFCEVEDHKIVTAQLTGEHLVCDLIKFHTANRAPISRLWFKVYFHGIERRQKLDNPKDIHVFVYDCSLLATNCAMCIALQEQYNCGWCEERNTCTTHIMCDSEWMNGTQRCTKPVITSFYPKSGLSTQETNITIEGENLGRYFEDIEGGIKLVTDEGDLISECTPYEELYVTASRIVCRLAIPEHIVETNGTFKGFLEVKVFNEFVAVSEEDFSFVNPVITGLKPVKGIKSGGTQLKVQGFHMDAGSTVEVFIGELPCNIIRRTSSAILCNTSPSDKIFNRAVEVLFDGEKRVSPGFFFYVDDPRINRVMAGFNSDGPSGTPSGGNRITVKGENFDYIQNPPYIYVFVDDEEYIGECRVESPTEIKCLSPRIPAEKLNFCSEGILRLDYAFMLDDVKQVQNYSTHTGNSKFQLYPDPLFMPFKEKRKIKHYKSNYLTINGEFLDSIFSEKDITVDIGTENCLLKSLSQSQLTCRPPTTQPISKGGGGNAVPEVVVKVAGTMEFFVGYLHYDT